MGTVLTVVGSLFMVLTLTGAIPISTNCQNTHQPISKLEIPKNIEFESAKYDEKIQEALLNAWNHAELSKKSAKKLANNVYLCSFLDSPIVPEHLQTALSFLIEFLTQTRSNYAVTIHSVSTVFKIEINQMKEDYSKMDRMGFDIAENSSFENSYFKEFENFALKNQEFIAPCDSFEIKSEHQCLDSFLKARTYEDGVNFFNEFIGDKRAIDLYEKQHRETVEIIDNLNYEYLELITEFDSKQKVLNNKISNLEKNEVNKINEDFEKKIEINSFNNVQFSSSVTPSKQLNEIKIQNNQISKNYIQHTYDSKLDNYLIKSLQMLRANVSTLNLYNYKVDELEADLISLKQDLFIQCNRKIDLLDPSFAVYFTVKELCSEKESLKQAIEDYSLSIKLANGDYSDYDYLLLSVEDSINQMEKLGSYLDFEKTKLKNIKNNEASISLKYISLLNLKKLIEVKAELYFERFDSNNEKINNYFHLIELHNDIFKIESNEFNNDNDKINLINSKEFLPNCYNSLISQQDMIEKYKIIITSKASKYFSKQVNYNYFFDKIPECNEKLNAKLIVSIENNLETIKDVSFEAIVFENNEKIFVPYFEKGKVYSKGFEKEVVAFTCSEQLIESVENSFVVSKKIKSSFVLNQALVPFSLPVNSSVDSCSGQCVEENKVYLENVEGEVNVFILYSLLSEELNEWLDENPVDEKILINPTPSVFEEPDIFNEYFNGSLNFDSINDSEDDSEAEKVSLTSLDNLFLVYEKAIDSNVSIPSDYINNNLDYFNNSFNEVKSMTGLSVIEFNSKAFTLEEQLSFEINELERKAKESYTEATSHGTNEYLERALEYYEKGYYTRSIIYSNFSSSLKENKDSSFIYMAAFLIILFSSYLILRKQKPEKIIEKKIERKLHSF